MPDNVRSSVNKAPDKRANEILIKRIHNEFTDVFFPQA